MSIGICDRVCFKWYGCLYCIGLKGLGKLYEKHSMHNILAFYFQTVEGESVCNFRIYSKSPYMVS